MYEKTVFNSLKNENDKKLIKAIQSLQQNLAVDEKPQKKLQRKA